MKNDNIGQSAAKASLREECSTTKSSESIMINKKEKTVYQFDLCGNYIIYYKSIKIANEITLISINDILNTCNKNNMQAGGYFWSFKKRFDYKADKNTAVACYTLNGSFIRSYTSILNAAKLNNITEKDINMVICGKHKSCKFLRWRYFYGNTSNIKSI